MLDPDSVSASQRLRQRPRTVAVHAADGSVVAREVTVADRFGSRLMGLMGRGQVGPDEGLWLLPCNSVHMFFMRTPLDIAYLDRQQRVVRCVPDAGVAGQTPASTARSQRPRTSPWHA